jgi:hypothetical protein
MQRKVPGKTKATLLYEENEALKEKVEELEALGTFTYTAERQRLKKEVTRLTGIIKDARAIVDDAQFIGLRGSTSAGRYTNESALKELREILRDDA